MEPDYKKAAQVASGILSDCGINSASADPLTVLDSLPNVKTISYDSSAGVTLPGDNQDALTLVDRINGKLKYIILYNLAIPAYRLRRALARELAHVALHHDGKTPEEIWSEESDCFAYHFVAHSDPRPVCFRPEGQPFTMSMKSMRIFDSLDAMKRAVAEEHTRLQRFVGNPLAYVAPDDVHIVSTDNDIRIGWENCGNVMVAGRLVGCCGEEKRRI